MNNQDLLIAVVLSVLILFGFHYYYEKPRLERYQASVVAAKLETVKRVDTEQVIIPKSRAEWVAEAARVRLESETLHGSINLRGGRLDDLTLIKYRETIAKDAPEIILLSPAGSTAPHQAYYSETGWLADDPTLVLPAADTLWTADQTRLSRGASVTLRYDNGAGLLFERKIALDDQYLFTITDTVKNNTGKTVTLHPFALISRHGKPKTENMGILHEGPMAIFNDRLVEHKYDDFVGEPVKATENVTGWLGITDKYWLMALVPEPGQSFAARFAYQGGEDLTKGRFQADMRQIAKSIPAGSSASETVHLFAGAKELRVLDHYEQKLSIPRFDRAIDFGWFYFLTKPFLYLVDYLGRTLGNFGLAILVFTVLLKIVVYPLSLKSYRSSARLKLLQPEMVRIQERFKDDRIRQSTEMMELYKKEKVNPMSGCFPILLQIPIFFALYKVLFISIEMRHAPFYGWIMDLSAADPTNLFNLFGLLPFTPPSFLHIGIWPLLMGATMYLQQLLSPQPPDKTQARIFLMLPIMFTFLLGGMAAGLVIYWTWSNLLSILQQWTIMRQMENQGSKNKGAKDKKA
jgi:YidC/Oxa1 family membrane protein insertase